MSGESSSGIRTGVSIDGDPARAAKEVFSALAPGEEDLTVFFCSPRYDRDALEAALREIFGARRVIGCTTAGEITPQGYLDHSLTAFTIPRQGFAVATHLIRNLRSFEISQALQVAHDLRHQIRACGGSDHAADRATRYMADRAAQDMAEQAAHQATDLVADLAAFHTIEDAAEHECQAAANSGVKPTAAERTAGEKTAGDRPGACGTPKFQANRFAFLLIDGLSMREESVVSALYSCLGDIPLFGGSAGDGLDFGKTHVYADGAFHEDSAVVLLVETEHPTIVFKTQHFESTEQKMVVTAADVASRTVYELNGEPAAQEYARLVGVPGVDELDPTVFATNPVVVRIGGGAYVRSIQKVGSDNSLVFYCAIDEGLVLTLAHGVDLVEDLNRLFGEIHESVGPPQLIIGCDCILRNLELEREQLKAQVSDLLTGHNVVGFSTYGEQYNAMHVNQTFTGVAIGMRNSKQAG